MASRSRLAAMCRRLADLPETLFAGGWAFVVPYHAVYAVGWAANVENRGLRPWFLGLHLANVLLLIAFTAGRLRSGPPWRVRPGPAAFWVALAAVFWVPGAYLEFPADPWEHIRRTNEPSVQLRLRDLYAHDRVAYFWTWSLVGDLGPAGQRPLLGACGALWQWLLAYQLYRFCRGMGSSPAWARVQVVAVIALFGNNVFSFFRYYALSSSPLAYVAYLRALRVLVGEDTLWSGRSAGLLAATLAVAAANHPQAVLFFVLVAALVAARALVLRLAPRTRLILLVAVAAFWIGSLLLAPRVVHDPAAFGLRADRLAAPWIGRHGTYALWDTSLSLFQTLGAMGFGTLAGAAVLARCMPLWSLLVLAPPALLLCPPFVAVWSHATYPVAAWRLMLAVPWPLALPEIVRVLPAPAVLARAAGEGVRLAVALVAALLAGSVTRSPFFGKLDFLLERTPPALAMTALDPTVEWFRARRPKDPNCIVKSDAITEFVLASWLGRLYNVERTSGVFNIFQRHWEASGPGDLRHLSLGWHDRKVEPCGFLVADPEALARAETVRPWVGSLLAGHWSPRAPDLKSTVPPHFHREAEALLAHGWRKTRAPPHYWYYEPPAAAVR